MASLKDLMAAGEPLLQEALQAMRRYHKAQDAKAPVEEVDRLRNDAEALFKRVSEYQSKSVRSVLYTFY